MMNVGENRAQNGVLDCPESKNEEKVLSIDQMGSSRYAREELSFLRGSHQGSSLQVLIVVLTVDIRQIRTCGFHGIFPVELNSIMELKVLILKLYLVNPCVAEQKTLIVLLVDTPFDGRIASSLLCADVSNSNLFAVNLCACDIGSSKSPLISETSPLCFRNQFSDIMHEVTRGGAMADQAEQYIYQRFPYLRLDDTPSFSAGSDSDPSEASSAASQATPAGPHTPSSPRPVTPPPPSPSPRVGRITTDAGTSPQDYGVTPETSDGSPR
ncbi:hypothetical protein E3N88_10013 [Mikania micrantha]|uniref:Uncharacterized protein n=1 Tax=Mikania micrantha TaxID=192012 RepID=A0A5N6PB72_9ASTR|nr:hypothetical protein E3N88_10013 [Mikania micrantha]